jgi:peptidoglycan/xylan/chitin deacetylase (PgdA/CDA1 family)
MTALSAGAPPASSESPTPSPAVTTNALAADPTGAPAITPMVAAEQIPPNAPAVFSVPQGPLFTFDDCEARPGQGTTANYIKVLTTHHVSRAIFFLTGNCYAGRPDIVRMVRDAGYTIGNHTWTHADLTRLTVAAIDAQIEGGPASTVFRPPYGARNAVVDARVAAHHLQIVMWSASGGDSGGGVARTCDRILEDLRNTIKPGSIVLLHLFNPHSPAALEAYLSGRKSCAAAPRVGVTNP